MLSLQDLDPYHPWPPHANIVQSYPYPSSLDMDATQAGPSQYSDQLQLPIQETNPHLQTTTSLHFPSTLPQQQQQQQPHPQRRSPTTAQHLPSPTRANDLTQDPMMMSHVEEEMLVAQLAVAAGVDQVPVDYPASLHTHQSTNTAQSLGHNLDGSPSWNSAIMTTTQMQQLDRLYRFQAQHQSHGPQLRQDSSRQPLNSHSSIGQHHHPQQSPQPTQQQQRGPQPPPTPISHGPLPQNTSVRAHLYSQELRMQQEEQLRRQQQERNFQEEQQQQREHQERERRNSEEEYLRRLHGAYQGTHSNNHSPHSLAHPTGGHPYFPAQQAAAQQQQHQGEVTYIIEHTPLPHHHQQGGTTPEGHQAQYHPSVMLDRHQGGYHLVDGQLELAVQEGSPNGGMIRYDSPLPLV